MFYCLYGTYVYTNVNKLFHTFTINCVVVSRDVLTMLGRLINIVYLGKDKYSGDPL